MTGELEARDVHLSDACWASSWVSMVSVSEYEVPELISI